MRFYMLRQKILDFKLKRLSNDSSYPVKIPSSVLQTLQENGVIPDPFIDDNEKFALEVMEEDFEYEALFDCDSAVFASRKKELVFEGIDTLADVYLNGEMILKAMNMHRTYRADVTELIKEKENLLKLRFHSPLKFIRQAYSECECDGSDDAMEGFVHLRKAHYMFGWDWGARIPDAGIFRDVTLEGIDGARILSVNVDQEHSDGKVDLILTIDEETTKDLSCDDKAQSAGDPSGITYEVTLTDPTGSVVFSGDYIRGSSIRVEKPMLWWPNGFGEQNLYILRVVQKAGGIVTDEVTKRIGLRTLTVTRKKDEWGESFCHSVNGVDVFAMGADYIPEDNYLGRMNPDRTRRLLTDCRDVNFNTIRVWGGGFFPADDFYDICDELGLMVWQDLMFACGVYNLTDEFEDNIHAEIKDNLTRIRDHACLALICGNNEMEMFVKGGLWIKTHRQKADYIKMYEYLFPKWVKEYAPDTVYWPSSPSSGGSFDEPNDENRGDVHYWSVWHDNKPFTEYRKHFFRYLSEFGFQSLPSLKTLESVITDKKELNLFSYSMEKHQRNKSANSKIMQYMQATFRYPTDFDTLVYASQLLSGEAVKYGVEHFRRNRGRCMGTLYWQINDCWPVISWASIDYFGRWKALHYFAKRFFAPVLLSCQETSTVSEGIEINSEKTAFTPAIKLNVANETMKDRIISVEWELRDYRGKEISSDTCAFETAGTYEVKVPALSAVWLSEKHFPGIDIYSDYVSFRAREDGRVISEGSVLFVPAKYFGFEDPHLTVEALSDRQLKVTAESFAKNVEIRNENDDLVLSDNFFDMNPGERVVEIVRGSAAGLSVRSVYDIH